MQLKPINISLRTCTRGPLRCFRVYKSPPTQPTSYIAVILRSLNLYAPARGSVGITFSLLAFWATVRKSSYRLPSYCFVPVPYFNSQTKPDDTANVLYIVT